MPEIGTNVLVNSLWLEWRMHATTVRWCPYPAYGIGAAGGFVPFHSAPILPSCVLSCLRAENLHAWGKNTTQNLNICQPYALLGQSPAAEVLWILCCGLRIFNISKAAAHDPEFATGGKTGGQEDGLLPPSHDKTRQKT